MPVEIPETRPAVDPHYEYDPKILDAIWAAERAMLLAHCKVQLIRFDLRFPEGYPHDGRNTALSKLLAVIVKRLRYLRVDFQLVWAREQNESEAPHYHIVLFANGSRIQNPWALKIHALNAWTRIVAWPYDGLVHLCETNAGQYGMRLVRPPEALEGEDRVRAHEAYKEEYESAFRWASYLGKTRGKDRAPRWVKSWARTQM